MDERDDDLSLPSSGVLDAWSVPDPRSELADRIADAWHDERLSRSGVRPHRPRLLGTASIALGAAIGAAAAILVMLLLRGGVPASSEAAPVAAPTASPVTAPVPAPPDPRPSEVEGQVEGQVEAMRGEIGGDEEKPGEFVLDLDVEPDDARVRIEIRGRTVAEVVGDSRLLLPRERFQAEVTAADHDDATVDGVPEEGPETKVQVRLPRAESAPKRGGALRDLFRRKKPARSSKSSDLKNPFDRDDDDPAEVAILRIGTSRGVGPARVYVDGRFAGTTPITAYQVEPGRHTVEWHWDDGRTVRETVTATAGDVLTLKRG